MNDQPDWEAVADRMRAAADQSGKRSDAIAAELGISGAAVRKWFNRITKPSSKNLSRFAEAVGVSSDYLYFGVHRAIRTKGTLTEWRLWLADLIAEGMTPEAAIERLTGPYPDGTPPPSWEITDAERQMLEGKGADIKATLDRLAGADWTHLTLDQKHAVLRLIQAMSKTNQELRGEKPSTPGEVSTVSQE